LDVILLEPFQDAFDVCFGVVVLLKDPQSSMEGKLIDDYKMHLSAVILANGCATKY
jgi:hypothetical protein